MLPCTTIVGLLVLAQVLNYLVQLSRVEASTAGETSIKMWQRHQNEELPEEVRGILWMKGNTCPELQLTLEAGAYDKSSRTLLLPFGTAYSWSYNSDLAGWLEYAAVTLNLAFLSPGKLRVEFAEDFRSATIQITFAGISLAESAGLWALNRTDESGDFWNRMQWNASERKWELVYDIKKALGADGVKLPAWSQMVQSVLSGVVVHGKGCGSSMIKTDSQLVHGDFLMRQVFLTILFSALWLTLAGYCLQRSDAKAPSAEMQPLTYEPCHTTEPLPMLLGPQFGPQSSPSDRLCMPHKDLPEPLELATV
ncbi:unnamed protein product [Symbiodinium sp. CCMP2592]|nr:unnamed protein product [Symbiodinium sp. CCMP2592]